MKKNRVWGQVYLGGGIFGEGPIISIIYIIQGKYKWSWDN